MSAGILEICVDTVAGVDAAVSGGADRIELCSALAVGGLTPSVGLMNQAVRRKVPVYAMIRPYAGAFIFGENDIAIMLDDIDAAACAGLAGVALGVSLPDGRLDSGGLKRLTNHARNLGLATTLHRAFDMAPDPDAALETAIDLGFQRILTSGGAASAPAGLDALGRLFRRAAGRITVMPGSGVRPDTIAGIAARLPVAEIHASASSRSTASSARACNLGFEPEDLRETSSEIVRQLRAAWQTADQFQQGKTTS